MAKKAKKTAKKKAAKVKNPPKQKSRVFAGADLSGSPKGGGGDDHTIKLPSPEAIVGDNGSGGLHAKLTRLEKDKAGVAGDFAAAWKDHEKKNIHKGALQDVRKLANLSDAKLAEYLAHFDYLFDEVFKLRDRATKQLDLFKKAGRGDGEVREPKGPPAAGAALKPDPKEKAAPKGGNGEARTTSLTNPNHRPTADQVKDIADRAGAKSAAANANETPAASNEQRADEAAAIRKKVNNGESISQAEREMLADFDEKNLSQLGRGGQPPSTASH